MLRNEINVFPFDSGAGSAILAMMCREARLLDWAGISVQDILTKLENSSREANRRLYHRHAKFCQDEGLGERAANRPDIRPEHQANRYFAGWIAADGR